ncbi:S-adenosyl-l-methionine hydroxide adenosyltransferase family protein [Terrimonas sp. NA20]|uniref:S-adenosyl-l-methionine hydroxide adenosyltransferase family protein n=1 Tax=Terrimonas ginsenosidimutans TaxID=2908004 RepID=A0ABS9KW70_9BACT|nr:S-adenosyl-l-methionine hydroxide adenosyltransferase family protein [Terrimonas ginsenosidimutans]MCG2616571.1 S-adenosyl-l-methionine hydroxide adenosyltransferase family protein [Terrimonas ginsenosidimutans]
MKHITPHQVLHGTKAACLSSLMILIVMMYSCGDEQTARLKPIVMQTDFGLKDGAVSAMKGVAFSVDPALPLFDLTHEIPAYNIWEAAYRLSQTVPYWPAETVFVSVVDPGVGTDRQSVVARTKNGHYIVTPDNGTLTLLADEIGIESLRQIDEAANRRAGSSGSYTFHGRDVYAYTAAKLAAGKIRFDEVGPELKRDVTKIPYQRASYSDGIIKGSIPVLDIQYGNAWTNIPDSLIKRAGIKTGDSVALKIHFKDSLVYQDRIPFVHTFGEVPEGRMLGYLNSLMNFSIAINMGSLAEEKKISAGSNWTVTLMK